MNDLGEYKYQIQFYEHWDETITLSERELNEWFNELRNIVNDDSQSVWRRMQKIVDNITGG